LQPFSIKARTIAEKTDVTRNVKKYSCKKYTVKNTMWKNATLKKRSFKCNTKASSTREKTVIKKMHVFLSLVWMMPKWYFCYYTDTVFSTWLEHTECTQLIIISIWTVYETVRLLLSLSLRVGVESKQEIMAFNW